jgi:hypothetical protein
MAKTPLESELYPVVMKWLERHFNCFHVVKTKGINYSRIDVLGIRDIGGDLSGDVEAIAVEVKRGLTPFTNAAGQAAGYKVYADRVYLADKRPEPFLQDHIDIASNLGIGLIHIKGGRCHEVLSSPMHRPIPRLQLHLFRKLRLGKCQLCGSFFDPGTGNWANVGDQDLKKAIAKEKGLIFVLNEVEERKIKWGWSPVKREYNNYRFICRDCIANVLKPLGDK